VTSERLKEIAAYGHASDEAWEMARELLTLREEREVMELALRRVILCRTCLNCVSEAKRALPAPPGPRSEA
jgi:hypothetical protein